MNVLECKTILVTGASGFIGTHLVERLSGLKGIRLLLLSRQPHTSDMPNVQWLQGSLNDLTQNYWKSLGIADINVLFHLGAFTPKAACDANNVERVFTDNLMGTRTLLEGLPTGLQRIIFSSTLDVYARAIVGKAIAESSCISPSGLYGASKFFCEQLVSEWAKEHGCAFAILRYGHIFGPGEGAYRKLIPLVIRTILTGEQPSVYGTGLAERDLLYVSDAVEATLRAATIEGNIEPINIVRGESTPIREIVKWLIEEGGSKLEINFLNDKPDGYSLRFDNSRMRNVLGEWPLVSLEDGLKEEMRDFRRLLDE